jgi:C_GCAxxG_C_C family probable redox protein
MASEILTPAEQAAEAAHGSFSTGCNCAESVLEHVASSLDLGDDAIARSSGYAWTGGIDESGCLCGALAAAVSLAGQVAAREGGTEAQQRARARVLADEIRREFVGEWQGTCCRVVRHGLEFGTAECKENCGSVTAFTTQLAVEVLGRDREVTELGTKAWLRVTRAAGTGVLLGLQVAWMLALLADPGTAAIAAIFAVIGAVGLAWGIATAGRIDVRRRLARVGRAVAAASGVIAVVLAVLSALAPVVAIAANQRAADALGVPALAPLVGALWVVVPAAWAAPALFNLARRRGAR